MFEPVSESFVRMANLAGHYHSIVNKQLAYQKVQRVVRKRPVEKAKKSGNPKSNTDHRPNKDNVGDDLRFENYDKDGNIIPQVPEGRKRIGEIV